MTTPSVALQLCPFSAELEADLETRFDVLRWFDLDESEQQSWLAARAPAVRAVVTGGHLGCSNTLMEALPYLGIIAVNGVGLDKVDLAFARSRGVHVTNTPDAPTEDTADLAIGLVIGLLRAIPAGDLHVRSGAWAHGDRPLARRVTGRRFGIVGLGRIGSAIAARLAAFGPVAYTGPHRKNVPYEFHADLLGLARASDVMVLSCPANASTQHLVNADVLDALGSQSYLINVARGSIVDEAALIEALETGRLAGAALDVFEREPHVPKALRHCERVVLTPHMASATAETRRRMAEMVLENLDAFLSGRPPPAAAT